MQEMESEILHITDLRDNGCKDQLETANEELSALHKVNVYSDSFMIGMTNSGIGTINNLRLGRKQEESVEWEEINAAWGQCALLVHILSKKLGFTFSKYRIIPTGSRASIQQREGSSGSLNSSSSSGSHLTPPAIYHLYGSSANSFSRPAYFYEFWSSTSSNSNFDTGMECFLGCVSEICGRTISMNPSVNLPY